MGVFIVNEADAAAIREAFDQGGELAAAVELRRRFPGITDNVRARDFARTIVGWQPPVIPPTPVNRGGALVLPDAQRSPCPMGVCGRLP